MFLHSQDLWQILDIQRGPWCKIVVISTLINSINAIWFAMKQKRFNNTNIQFFFLERKHTFNGDPLLLE